MSGTSRWRNRRGRGAGRNGCGRDVTPRKGLAPRIPVTPTTPVAPPDPRVRAPRPVPAVGSPGGAFAPGGLRASRAPWRDASALSVASGTRAFYYSPPMCSFGIAERLRPNARHQVLGMGRERTTSFEVGLHDCTAFRAIRAMGANRRSSRRLEPRRRFSLAGPSLIP
jgi:hypothetical protein